MVNAIPILVGPHQQCKKTSFLIADSIWSSAPDDLAHKACTCVVSLVLHTSVRRTYDSFAVSGQRFGDSDHKYGFEVLCRLCRHNRLYRNLHCHVNYMSIVPTTLVIKGFPSINSMVTFSNVLVFIFRPRTVIDSLIIAVTNALLPCISIFRFDLVYS